MTMYRVYLLVSMWMKKNIYIFLQSFNLTFLYWSNLRISTRIKSVLMISSNDIEWTHLLLLHVCEYVSGSSFRDNVVDFFPEVVVLDESAILWTFTEIVNKNIYQWKWFFRAVKLKISPTRIFMSILQKWTPFPIICNEEQKLHDDLENLTNFFFFINCVKIQISSLLFHFNEISFLTN